MKSCGSFIACLQGVPERTRFKEMDVNHSLLTQSNLFCLQQKTI